MLTLGSKLLAMLVVVYLLFRFVIIGKLLHPKSHEWCSTGHAMAPSELWSSSDLNFALHRSMWILHWDVSGSSIWSNLLWLVSHSLNWYKSYITDSSRIQGQCIDLCFERCLCITPRNEHRNIFSTHSCCIQYKSATTASMAWCLCAGPGEW